MSDIMRSLIAAICTAIGFLFGETDGMFIALVVLITLDYISGVIAAAVKKELSSAVGAKGIAKKVFMLLIVVVANIVDVNVIGQGHALRTVVIIFYIANECISLLENAAELGVPFPDKLMDILKQLKDKNNK